MAFFIMFGRKKFNDNEIDSPDFLTDAINRNQVFESILNYSKTGASVFSNFNFDFVIVFNTNGLIHLVRDHFGNIPLFYFIKEGVLYYSTNIKDLINSKDYKKELNTSEIGNYFNVSDSQAGYNDQTFWKGIYSVLPGQVLSIDSNYSKSYSNFFNLSEAQKCSDFLTIFKKSLLKHISDAEIISSTLSGGIDSSSITCTSQSLLSKKINSIELRTSFEIVKERKFAQDVVEKWNTNHFILTKYPDFYESEKLSAQITGLPSFSLLTASRLSAIIDNLIDQNSNLLLLGDGGDQILGLQIEYLDELFANSKFVDLRKALINALGQGQLSRKQLFEINFSKAYLKNCTKQLVLKKELFKLIKFLFTFYTIEQFAIYLVDYIKKGYLKKKNNSIEPSDLIKIKFEQIKHDKINHLNLILPANKKHESYLINIFSRESIKLREQFYIYANHFGKKFIYPFYDLEILNFIVNSNKELNFGDGIGRNIIRQSMKGILPDSIIERRSKTYFSPFLFLAFLDIYSEFNKKFRKNHILWEYVDIDKFEKMVQIVKNTNYYDPNSFGFKNNFLINCMKVCYLGIWLDEYF